MATKTKVQRVSMYLKRKEGLSIEEFNKYWSEVHGPLVRTLLEKHGILKYTQYHTSDTFRSAAADTWPELKALNPTSYDGVAEFVVKDIMDIKKSREDPFFWEQIRPDEQKFFEDSGVSCTIGWEEVYIEDNKLVPESQSRLNSP